MFVIILATLQLGVDVRCYQNNVEWEAQKALVNTNPHAVAYFNPYDVKPHIAIGPKYCKAIKRPTLLGAFVLGHELAHYYQWLNGTPFDEEEADDMGRRWSLGLLHKLEKLFKRKSPSLITLQP